MGLNINISKRPDGAVLVAVSGSLNSDTYESFEAQVHKSINKATKALILDLKLLDYISSMGISAVLKVKKAAEATGARFLMINLPPQIREVFRIINALPAAQVFKDMEEADAYLLQIQRKIQEGTHPASD
jgi:anti-anti-sigma factor